jgi:hypothetical protein
MSDKEFSLNDLRLTPEKLSEIHAAQAQERKPRKRVDEPFVIAPVKDLTKVAADLDSWPLLVWLFLLYLARVQNTESVTVTNQELAKWGIDRHVKRRTLERLEAAGRIRVER